jgi:cytochrome c5
VQSETAKTRLFVLTLMKLSILLLGSNAVAQQSALDNIRPVGQVCVAGQSCVGNSAASAAAVQVAAPVAAVAGTAEQVVETQVVETQVVDKQVEAAPEVAAFDVAATYQTSCFGCHSTGAAGAPIVGDAEAWASRMEKGFDAVMANVMTGVNAMPPKGLCMTCSDDNLRSLVDYMVSQ